ncbi:MAG: ABC transporter substrate-binding protein [Anaerovoracaceae bacterium]
MKYFKRVTAVGLIIVMLFSLTSCLDDEVSIVNKKTVVEESNKVYLEMDKPETLNPILSMERDVYNISKLVYDSLFTVDNNYKPVNGLVSNYNYDKSNNKLTLALEHRINWHDGDKFTAKDVEFTINAIKAVGSKGPYFQMIDKIGRASVTGEYSIDIYFKDKNNMALENLCFPILPSHKFNSSYEAANKKTDFNLVGTGQYKSKKYLANKELFLKANSKYFGEAPRSEVHILILPENANKTKLVESSNISALEDPSEIRETKIEKKGMKIKNFADNKLIMLGYNFKNENLQNVNLRKAIAHVVDKKAIIEEIYINSGISSNSIYPPGYYEINKKKDSYKYSLEKASSMLKKGGLTDSDKDKVIEDKKGNNLSLNILTNSDDQDRVRIAEMLQEYLEDIGLQATVTSVPQKTYLSYLERGKFDLYIGELSLDETYDFRPYLHSAGAMNFGKYTNENLDSNMDKIFQGISTENKGELVKKIDDFTRDELPCYPICYKSIGLIKAPTLKGEVNPNYFNIYNNINTWYNELEITVDENGEDVETPPAE